MTHSLTIRLRGLTIRVSPAVLALLPISFALGLAGYFCILFIAVTTHEMAHILTARRFGLRTSQLNITPLGEMALIENTASRPFSQRLSILLAGPMTSLFLAAAAHCLSLLTTTPLPLADGFLRTNLAIGLFNLLPFCPLDGGRVFLLLLERAIGIPPAHRFMHRLSAFGGLLLMAAGLVQAVFFPFNLSLYCIGVYLRKTALAARHLQAADLYRDLVLRKIKTTFDRPLPIRHFAAPSLMPVKTAYTRLHWDSFHTYHLPNGTIVTEADLLRYIRENGLRGALEDCVRCRSL